jgi:hypothetical protein
MKASLSSLSTGLKDLKHYVQGLEIQSNLVSSNIKRESTGNINAILSKLYNHISKSPGSLKRFEYNTIIISLYGYLEQFIESIITAYVNALNDIIPVYQGLPEPIKKSHLGLSFGLINRQEQQRYHGKISPQKLISNLNSCYYDEGSYRINADAYSQHTANFKVDIIDTLFARVGVTKISKLVQANSDFMEFLIKIYPDRQIDHMKREAVFYHLNDLAERRNEVAHGATTDQILSRELLLDYIDFFEAYGPAMYDVLHRSSLPYIANYKGVEVGKPIAVYNNCIVCFELTNIDIATGDILIAQPAKSSDLFCDGKIQELQVDHVKYDSINVKDPLKVAMRVGFKAKPNQNFFYISKL